jgi:ribokinase
MGKRILVVGSINLDLVVSTNRIPQIGETITGKDFQTFFGGKGANQAVGVARLGYPVSMIGRVGNDEFGRRLRRALSLAGVQAQAVRVTSQTPSGVALITVESQGRNSIVVIPGANGKLTPWDIRRELALVRSAGLILSQLEIPLETVDYLAAAAARFGIPFVLDPAPAQKLPSSLLKRVAWLTPNETEAGILCGASPDAVTTESARKVAKSLLKRGPQNIALKLGSRGVYWASGNGESFVPAFKVQAVDSTAAGDAFNAGLAVSLMKGAEPPEAVRFASAVAALSVTRAGAQPSMPTAREVSRFLKVMEKGGNSS